MKKILLTGGNGFFGSRFQKQYSSSYTIISTDVPELDILNTEKIDYIVQKVKPDVVIHAAAIALTDYCNDHPEICRSINVDGAVNVAKACRKTGGKMIFLSTEQVFNGNTKSGPYTERDQPVPNTNYGRNKLEAEGLLREILNDLVILRFSWIFGVPQRGLPVVNNILWDTVSNILQNNIITASSGEFRGYTNIEDLIDRFDKIITLPPGTYHIGSRNDLSRHEVCRLIFNQMGLSHRIGELLKKKDLLPDEPARDVRLNTDKAASFGIIFPTTEEAIEKCIKDYSLNIDRKNL
ncbi:MAG: NAD(P)-dependent oxidoreductase [Bacteroidetes bacterium]|nr:NAD(P)-dependent oxidoreductase [Bacteroidota bacterium]